MRAPISVASPRIDPLVLQNLFDGEAELLKPGADLDDLRFAGVRGEKVDVSGSTTSGCAFEDVVADEFSIATSRVTETRFRQCGVPLFRMARSVLRDVEFDGGRLGAVEAYDVQARAVHFRGCRPELPEPARRGAGGGERRRLAEGGDHLPGTTTGPGTTLCPRVRDSGGGGRVGDQKWLTAPRRVVER